MHNFPSHIKVSTDKAVTLEQAKTILKLCIDNDVKIYSSTFEMMVDKKFSKYCWLNTNEEITQTYAGPGDDGYIFVSFTEFCNYIKGKGKKIKAPFREGLELNSSYSAIVTKDSVIVGCQTFSHNIINKLAELSKKAQFAEK